MKKIAILVVMMVGVLLALAGVSLASIEGTIVTTSAVTVTLQNYDPNPALAGETFEVRAAVDNIGDAAKDVVVEALPEYPFSPLQGFDTVQTIGDMGAHQGGDLSRIVKFNLRVDKDASAGTYLLKVFEYENGDREHGISYTLPIEVKVRESAEVILIDQTTIVPGIVTPMKFTINNIGNAPIRDLTFSWDNKDKVVLPVGGDNTQHIAYLDQGQSTDLTYNVIADPSANTGLYSLDLSLSYLDTVSGNRTGVTTTSGVYVGGGTDFDAAFSQSSSGDTSFSIANIGANVADSVTVSVPDQQGWRVSGPNTVIIGNLNKGDYTVATFAIQSPFGGGAGRVGGRRGATSTASATGAATAVPAAAPTNATGPPPSAIKLDISYTDTRGQRQMVEKDVKLSPSDVTTAVSTTTVVTPSFWSKYQWYIIIVVVAVVAYMVYRKYQRKNGKVSQALKKK